MEIITNYHRREPLDGSSLTPSERDRFDYVDWPAVERGEDSVTLVRYRGELYDLGDMEGPALGWGGHLSDTFFSGVLFSFVREDGEDLIVAGRYYS